MNLPPDVDGVKLSENIVMWDPAKLRPYARNSRKHSPEQIRKIAASILRFGFIRPVVVNEATGEIIAGHGSTEAALSLKLPKVPVIVVGHLTDEERRAFVIADNKLAEESEWDETMLAEELAALAEAGFDDLKLTGFDDEELADLVGDELVQVAGHWRKIATGHGQTSTAENEDDEDEFPIPELPAVAITRTGDLWRLGEHRILCGDSRNAADVARLMDGKIAQLLLADPPYGMGKQSVGVANDNIYNENLDVFQMEWWRVWRPHLLENASAYVWGNAEDLWRLWYCGGLRDAEKFIQVRNEIVWDKGSAPGMKSADIHGYQTGSERCLFLMMGEQLLGNVNACDYFEGWEPVRGYLAAEVEKMKWKPAEVNAITGVQMFSHWFSKSQWCIIPRNHYESLAAAANGLAFTKPFDALRQEYENCRKNYREHLDKYRSYFDNTHAAMIDVWKFPRVVAEDRHGHATPKPKPIGMIGRQIFSSSASGFLVVEPFAGSGSTLIAAHNAGRICYTMELLPQWVDVVIRRWQSVTGQKATLEDGRTFDEVYSERSQVLPGA